MAAIREIKLGLNTLFLFILKPGLKLEPFDRINLSLLLKIVYPVYVSSTPKS